MRFSQEKIDYAIGHGYDSITQCTKCGKITYLKFANGLRNGWGLCCGYTPTLVWHNADIEAAVGGIVKDASKNSNKTKGETE